MKNAIMYYYHFSPEEIHQVGKNYYFKDKETLYFLRNCTRPSEELTDLYAFAEELNNLGYPVQRICKNAQNKLFIVVQDEMYVLLEIKHPNKDGICLGEILSLQKAPVSTYKYLYREKWDVLWSSKIDYFEYQVSQFGKKYPVIRESFSYFCGLAENAIAYAHTLDKSEHLTLSHKRIYNNMCAEELYNPLTFILDDRTRDVVEYFKDKFMNGYLASEEWQYYLLYCISKEEYARFYARMLYPSFYFDIYEDVMQGKKKENELIRAIQKSSDYEALLFDVWFFMNQYIQVSKPEWIQKKER